MKWVNETVKQTKTLFISAGHSDTDPGATGHGLSEADIVLDFRDRLARCLRSRSVIFAKDGEPGQNLPLRDAVTMAKRHDVSLEFHCNAFINPKATGVETLSKPAMFPLGERITALTAKVLGIPDRGAKPDGSGQHSRLAFAQAGGIIVELFFISNRDDIAAYQANKLELARKLADLLVEVVTDDQTT